MNRLPGLLVLVAVAAHAETLPQDGTEKHMGVASCAASQCHGSAVPRDGSAVLQNEYVTWTQDDPHSGAYATLNSDQSKAMALRLGLKSAAASGICLDCHADNVASASRGERFQLTDGVGCEACHGGSENWLASHYNAPTIVHKDNLESGLYPTERPQSRAELCLSCHLGTANKFATHRIMAAGHPRLTFELDTFTELWRTAGRQPHYKIDEDYEQRKNAPSHTYVWATGLLADGRRRLDLIQNDQFGSAGLFPELGLYDCHACHRSMKSVQWRRLPRHGNAGPGVPFLSDGTLVMALALAGSVQPSAAQGIEASLTALHVASSQTIADVKAAAMALDAELGSLQRSMSEQSVEQNRDKLLQELLRRGAAGEYLDYASAEQAFMAVQMLAFELEDTSLQKEIDALAKTLEDDERYRPPQFASLFRSLQDAE